MVLSPLGLFRHRDCLSRKLCLDWSVIAYIVGGRARQLLVIDGDYQANACVHLFSYTFSCLQWRTMGRCDGGALSWVFLLAFSPASSLRTASALRC